MTRTLRRLRAAAHGGNLRDLRTALTAVAQAAERARDEANGAAASWTFDEEAYFASGAFTRELLAAARDGGLQMFERDERLYCYPVLVRVSPPDRAVFVDRTRERRVRPSVLVQLLRDVQGRPPRFRPEAFLEALFTAYGHLARRRGDAGAGHAEPLVDVHGLLTLMPGAAGLLLVVDIARCPLNVPKLERDEGVYYSRPATFDVYEVLRQLIDGTDELEACFVAILAGPEFTTDLRRSYVQYPALHYRLADEVHDRYRPNPLAALVRVADGAGG